MLRHQLEHIIRAASVITGAAEFVILGSQAILGQFANAPAELLTSIEADVFPLRSPAEGDLIDGSIGEGSPFHMTFGYYAHGVGPDTAILPNGWRERLIPIRNENTAGGVGLCLEAHDLAVSKLVAGPTSLSLAFMVDGKLEKRIWVTAQVNVREGVVVSNRALPRNALITEDDVRLEKMDVSELPADVISDDRAVIGMRTKRAIERNTPLRSGFVETPPLVKRGDLVTIVAESDTLKITTQGVATESGGRGDLVRVINAASRQEVYAKVVDGRTVAVDF